jgi:hypothetical protein
LRQRKAAVYAAVEIRQVGFTGIVEPELKIREPEPLYFPEKGLNAICEPCVSGDGGCACRLARFGSAQPGSQMGDDGHDLVVSIRHCGEVQDTPTHVFLEQGFGSHSPHERSRSSGFLHVGRHNRLRMIRASRRVGVPMESCFHHQWRLEVVQ